MCINLGAELPMCVTGHSSCDRDFSWRPALVNVTASAGAAHHAASQLLCVNTGSLPHRKHAQNCCKCLLTCLLRLSTQLAHTYNT